MGAYPLREIDSLRMRVQLQERVRAKLRALVEERDVPLRVLGERLHLSPSGVGRILNDEGYSIMWKHVETFCEFFQITPSELLAAPGAMIQVISPTEAALLRLFRQMAESERLSLLTILERPVVTTARRPKQGYPRLNEREQELLDLFHRAGKNAKARDGVIQTLKAIVKHAEQAQDRKTE